MAGFTLIETLVVCAIVGWVGALVVPGLRLAARMQETSDAATYVAGQFRAARQRAVLTGRHVALVFESAGPTLGWRRCEDGDRDGVSRTDIQAGVDRCAEGEDLLLRFPHVIAGYHSGVAPLGGSTSPVRFGVSRMAVFTPLGTATAGTIVLAGSGGSQVAVRVSGVTGRVRVLRYDRASGAWPE